ncbi:MULTISPECIES: CBS domain-containing protein [Corynebacterium]|uniref:CBS domain-containing protein n=1 Tax=Corynebacterium aurimucosum TaxID=169292 RepID=A0A2N6TIM5_9CORY|nr:MULTISPECIES: CBS domain-containing protein [Corynebacterium]OFN77491.1 hypothetical protein HMPREF2526_02440 [Corynebacterium sp. HMSC070E08]OFO18851.1 hypothetical protein HMPREF3056_02095 [Corynebacterium sp. HMSC056F09]PMC69146.1 CBS domain-containing protein [Corynebacterium aurimucosum]TVU85235.1 CBS domain-containing protein [Corynebacterium aurimucosum]
MSDNSLARFFSAFNDIEQFLRQAVGAKNSDSFWWIVDRAHDKHLLSKRQAEQLKDLGNLRNAIAHGRYFDGEPIATPHPQVLAQLENLQRLLTDPPTAQSLLANREVTTLGPDTPIMEALRLINRTGYSQIPIYDSGAYQALLTTNVIARWVAADLGDDGVVNAASISAVLEFAEKKDRAEFLPRNASAQEVIDALTEPAADGTHPSAVLLTEQGKPSQRPLAIATPADLAVLVDALEWE